MKLLFLYTFIIIFSTIGYAQNLNDDEAKLFINALLRDSDNLQEFVEVTELSLSKRLGISYPNSKNKFLISNEFEFSVKEKILNGKVKYKYQTKKLKPNYSQLIIEVPKEKVKLEYFFYNTKLISKPFYYSTNWKKISSKYFIFHVSDTTLINKYSISNLDAFVDKMLSVLNCNNSEIQKLEREKIHYFLCKDKTDIKQLTNYSARGLYFIPFDYIISTFNSHYHEIAHLLMNYKLKSVKLYTLPLLQEGFAVAYGGRGGKEPNVILEMGRFLIESNFLNYDLLLSKKEFYQFDASMTYPVAGLYVKFLINSLGISEFINLYRHYSTTIDSINTISINSTKLPTQEKWEEFVHQQSGTNFIHISNIDEQSCATPLYSDSNSSICETENEYIFRVKNSISIRVNENSENYSSKLFRDLFPKRKFQNEKYIIMANSDEVSVYNFYTNSLMAKYVKGFSAKGKSVMQKKGYFYFSIKKSLFDESFEKWIILKSEIK